MASVLDTAILLGKETTYGTPASLTTAYEGKADSWKREHEYMESLGFRAGMQAKRSDRRKVVNMGGTGALEFDVMDKGFGFLAQALLGSSTGPTQQASTTAYVQTHTTSTTAPGDSYTIQVHRITTTDGTVTPFTHHGCTVTGWKLSQEAGGYLTASVDFDFEDVDTTTAAGTPSYPASTVPFDWTMCSVTVDGSAVEMNQIELTAELGLKTDRRTLRASALKRKPMRAAFPEFSGSMEGDFEGNDIYDLYVSGEIVPIVFNWTGAEIESGHNYEIELTMPACQIVGDSPEASLEDLTKQPVSFMALDDGSNPVVTMEIKSTDTSL